MASAGSRRQSCTSRVSTHKHIELQLAHTERNQVSAAYNHALYLPQRCKMMQAWADHLDALRKGAKVMPFKAA